MYLSPSLSRPFAILLFLLLAGVAHAESIDESSALTLQAGSVFKLVSRIYVPSSDPILFRDGDIYRYYSQMKARPFCTLEVSDRHDQNLSSDLLLQAGSHLKVLQVSSEDARLVRIILIARYHYFVQMTCYHSMVNGFGTSIPSLGDIKSAFTGVLEIQSLVPVQP